MRWATRTGVHIDRAACAWLIRRLVDLDAQFAFLADPAQRPPEATGFDAPEAPGLDVVLRGLSMTCDDQRTLALTGPVFDGLYDGSSRLGDPDSPCIRRGLGVVEAMQSGSVSGFQKGTAPS